MKLAKDLNLKDVLVLDIETARVTETLEYDSPLWHSWAYKKKFRSKKPTKAEIKELQDSYEDEAALYPEFAKIVVISVGIFDPAKGVVRIKSYNSTDERTLLQEFNSDLRDIFSARPKTRLCGHAAIGFDVPFIFKRCLINRVPTQYPVIDTVGLKPWEVSILDTKDMWKGTSFNATGLTNIATAFGIPTPKDDISGADVGRVYYEEGASGLNRITVYCEKDVLTTANVLLAFRGDAPYVAVSKTEVKPVAEDVEYLQYLVDGGELTDTIRKAIVSNLVGMKTAEEVRASIDILNALVSGKKGSATKIKKADVTSIAKEVSNERTR